MVKFEELEKKICQSRGNYSLTDNGRGKKTYAIFSEDLKNSLRDVIHSTARLGEWQINHTVGSNLTKYRKEQDGKFGIYQKNTVETSPDEFVILSESQVSAEKKEFEEANKSIADSKQAMEEHRKQMEEHQRQVANSNQIIENSRRQIESLQQRVNQGQNFSRSGESTYISVSGDERVIREAFEILARQQRESADDNQTNQNQQAQICQKEHLKFPFFDKGKKS